MTQFYLAPMEEVTGYVYRNVYHAMFGDMERLAQLSTIIRRPLPEALEML